MSFAGAYNQNLIQFSYLFQVCEFCLRVNWVLVNSWPSPVGDGSTDVSIEYEINSKDIMLEDVLITIPMPEYVPLPFIIDADM